MKKLFLIFVGLLLCTVVYGADRSKLHPILVTPSGEIQLFFEPGSVQKIGSSIRYRMHVLFTPSHNMPFEDDGVKHSFDEPVSKLVDTIELSCTDSSYITVKKEFFGVDDNLIWTYEPSEDISYEQVNLQNVSGVMWNLLCQNKKFKSA